MVPERKREWGDGGGGAGRAAAPTVLARCCVRISICYEGHKTELIDLHTITGRSVTAAGKWHINTFPTIPEFKMFDLVMKSSVLGARAEFGN